MVETWIIDGEKYTTEPTRWSYDELEQLNAELLAALKVLQAHCGIDNEHSDVIKAYELIAKAEAG